jgi:hypothetical protein
MLRQIHNEVKSDFPVSLPLHSFNCVFSPSECISQPALPGIARPSQMRGKSSGAAATGSFEYRRFSAIVARPTPPHLRANLKFSRRKFFVRVFHREFTCGHFP